MFANVLLNCSINETVDQDLLLSNFLKIGLKIVPLSKLLMSDVINDVINNVNIV